MRDVMPMNIDDHLDEVLGIVEKPKKLLRQNVSFLLSQMMIVKQIFSM